MVCNNEKGCVIGLEIAVTHGTESCGDRKDVEPVRETGNTEVTESDES